LFVVSDSFTVDIFDATLDYINITDSPAGVSLDTVTLPIGGNITVYASGYNHTGPTYVGMIEVSWVGSGGTWLPTIGTSAMFTAGFVSALYRLTGQNLTLSVFDTFNVYVQPPTVDYIEITNTQNGTPIDTVELPVGGRITVYASGYNFTGPTYVCLAEGVWSQSTLLGSFSIIQGNSTTFAARMSGGTAIINFYNSSLGLSDNFTLIIKPPTVDYIQIRNASGGKGDVVVDITFTLEGMVTGTFYCAAYNHTAGFIGDREVEWEVTGGIGTMSPETGLSTTFTATNTGTGTIIANLTGIINSTGIITVNPAEIPDIPPATPGIFTLEAEGSDKIKIEWSPYTEPDLAGYIIQRSTSPNVPWLNVITVGIESTSYTDTDLESDTTYYYRIIAIDQASNESPPSPPHSATTFKEEEFPWIWILITIVITGILVSVFVVLKKHKPMEAPFQIGGETKVSPHPPSLMITKEDLQPSYEVEAPSEVAERGAVMFECPLCNTLASEDAKSCPGCGAIFAAGEEEAPSEVVEEGAKIFLCPVCATLLTEDAKSCTGCGGFFAAGEEEGAA